MDNLMTSGELAELTGLTVKQIYLLAERGVLVPVVSGDGPGNHRLWSQAQAVRVAAAVKARREADLILAGHRPVPHDPELSERVAARVRRLARRKPNPVGRSRGLCGAVT